MGDGGSSNVREAVRHQLKVYLAGSSASPSSSSQIFYSYKTWLGFKWKENKSRKERERVWCERLRDMSMGLKTLADC